MTVQLRFELGDPQAPRGHAIVYANLSGSRPRVVATYCVVLPITFALGKYLPPMFAAQMPTEGLREASTLSVVPVPPMLEDIPNLAELRALAERRGDDLCDMGAIVLGDDSQRMMFAAEASQAYGQLYATYSQTWPTVVAAAEATAGPAEELDVDDVLAEVMSDRDRLEELAKDIGRLRYAIEGSDKFLMKQTERSMRRLASTLAEKYRAEQLIDAAKRTDERGARLAQLYLERAYKLLDEDYAAIPPLEQQIRELRDET
jgi:hypothetical protein